MAKTKSVMGQDVYKVPETLYEQYHGTGYALAAIWEDEIKSLLYLEDIDPNFYIDQEELEASGIALEFRLMEIMQDLKVG